MPQLDPTAYQRGLPIPVSPPAADGSYLPFLRILGRVELMPQGPEQSGDPMHTVYVDADACPVKEEVYRVARRYGVKVVVVANAPQRVPADPLVELVVRAGFGAADDWIAGVIGPGDIAVTADVPLAARCVAAGAVVIDPKGRLLTADTVGEALAVRDLMEGLRQAGTASGGPAPMTPKDRSKFLSRLDETINAVRRVHPPR